MKTCNTCSYWNFKLGGLPTGQEWGECLNRDVIKSTRISQRLVDYGEVVNIESTEQYRKITQQVDTYARIQVEAGFGCAYYEGSAND